jgi:hypothetical protein
MEDLKITNICGWRQHDLKRNKNLYAQLCRELDVEAELTKPWRLDGK